MTVHIVRRKRADGSIAEYHYAYRGGPRLLERPGTPAYEMELKDKSREPNRAELHTLNWLIREYAASSEFTRLALVTRKNYEMYFGLISNEFGTATLSLFEDPRMRAKIKRWRDTMRKNPRKADYAVAVLKRILSFAFDDRIINTNIAQGLKGLHKTDRASVVWEDEELEALAAHASPAMMRSVHFARLTGLRRGDCIRITKGADKGTHLEWVASKTKSRLYIPIVPELRAILDNDQAPDCLAILHNTKGRPWSVDGFSTSFMKARSRMNKQRAENGLPPITKRFHDLRGTAATHFMRAGLDDREIATITGWSEDGVAAIRKRYVSTEAIMRAAVERIAQEQAKTEKTENA